jgi:hypothetical protein
MIGMTGRFTEPWGGLFYALPMIHRLDKTGLICQTTWQSE